MLRTRVRLGLPSVLILSALFAALFTAVGATEVFSADLAPSYGVPTPVVLRVPYGARIVRQGRGQLYDVTFQHHRIVLPRGSVLDPAIEAHRTAIKYDALRRPPRLPRLASAFALYFFGLLVLSSYFRRFGHPRLRLLRSQVGIFSLVAVGMILAKSILLFTALPAYWIPLSAIALWVALGFDRRTALLLEVAVAFMVASLLRFDLMLLTVFMTRGLTAALLFFNRKQPRQMIVAGLASGIAAAIALAALTVLLEGRLEVRGDLALGLGSDLLACVGGGLLSGLLGNLLREPAELTLGHVSRSKLLDLTDIESPLLRKMAADAPGSWEHSRAMANLAEGAAAAIGADSLLTRVGAYYHDLGKTVQAKYFIENLAAGEASPHDDLPPEVSADAIMAHVVLGTKMLREQGIPEPVVEFAYTHHGTQLVEYFWNAYREREQDEAALAEGHFRYPGMKPMSKETAILMLVDSIEAASRTVEPPSEQSFAQMIHRIVFHKLAAGQLDDAGLTLSDIKVLTGRMAATLVNMYHGRIKYPWQRDKAQEPEPATAEEPRPAERESAPTLEVVEQAAPDSVVPPPQDEVGGDDAPPPTDAADAAAARLAARATDER